MEDYKTALNNPGTPVPSLALKPLNSVHIEEEMDEVKLLARTSPGLTAMYEIKQKYLKSAKPGKDLIVEVDAETGAEINRNYEPQTANMELNDPSESSSVKSEDSDSQKVEENKTEGDEDAKKNRRFYYPCYGKRYYDIEAEMWRMVPDENEKDKFLMTSICDRILSATCVLRNLSFSLSNRLVIAHKPEFQKLLWTVLEKLGEHEILMDSEIRTLDLCKDLLNVLGNISLYLKLPSHRHALILALFLLSFAPVDSPYNEEGQLQLLDYDIDVYRYLPNAIDIFVKIVPREDPNRKIVEEVLLGTCTDKGYLELIQRWIKSQNRTKLYPAELLSRFFALTVAMLPLTHSRPPSRDIETRQPYLLQAFMSAELLIKMIPDEASELNVSQDWLCSSEDFGARLVRTLNFMGMVVVNQTSNEPQRPFAKITQRGVNIIQQLFKKAKQKPHFSGNGVDPTIEHLLGGLMAIKMDKTVVKHLTALYEECAPSPI